MLRRADEQLVAVIIDIFMAGTETTGNVLGFALIYMILNRHVQTQVQKEIDDVLQGRQPSLADIGRYSDIVSV